MIGFACGAKDKARDHGRRRRQGDRALLGMRKIVSRAFRQASCRTRFVAASSMTLDLCRRSIVSPLIFHNGRLLVKVLVRFWINSTWLSPRLRWHCFMQSVKYASIIAHNLSSQPFGFNWSPGVAVCTVLVFGCFNYRYLPLTLFLASQSRDFDSTLAEHWLEYVANGCSEVPHFDRSTKLFEAEKVCVICLERAPHLVFPSCGHRVLCTECFDEYLRRPGRTCPLCRQD